MTKQTINIGTSANDGTGSTLRAAFDICNDNFTELYDGTGGLLHKIEGTNFTGSLLVGHSTTGTLSSAENNTGVGINSLKSITSGDANIGLGGRTGFNLTTGSRNILVGYRAGENITTGSFNVAIGDEALFTEDENGKNIAIGYHALRAQDAGSNAQNVAIGHQSGKSITTGIQNTMIGGLAADALTSGTGNVALGWASLSSETTGNRNTAVGWKSLQQLNNTGTAYNVAFGYEAGLSISTGIRNTILGGQAGNDLTTGSNNTIIGYDATASAVDVSNEVTIGNSNITNVRIPSDSTLKIGASGDLQLEHVSSNSFIKNTAVGDLYIENQVDDASIIFRCDDGSGGLDTYFSIVGAGNRVQYNKDLRLIDNAKATFGSSDDLEIYHDSTTSNIVNNTGNLSIINNTDDGDIKFFSDNGSGSTIEYFRVDGSSLVTIFSKAIKLMDSVRLNMGDQNDLHIRHNGTNGFMTNSTGDLFITNEADDKDLIFKCDDGSGSTTEYFRLDGSTVTTVAHKQFKFEDDVKLFFGTGADSALYASSDNLIIEQTTDDKDIVFKSDDGSGGVTEYFRVDGGSTDVRFSKNTRHLDNVRAEFGSSGNFVIKHDGADTLLQCGSSGGNLTLQVAEDDHDMIFQCDNGSGGLDTYFLLDGSEVRTVFAKGARFNDSIPIELGGSTDAQIFHNGTDTVIDNLTGDLYISNKADDKDIIFRSDDGSGGFTTYFFLDGSLASGGSVFTVFPDNSSIVLGTGNDLQAKHNGTDTTFDNYTGDLKFQNYADDKDIVFSSDDGSGGLATYFKIDGSGTTTVFHKDIRFDDSVLAKFGADSDLRIYHDSSNSYIENNTNDLIILNNANDKDIVFQCDDDSGGVTTYLRLDGSTKTLDIPDSIPLAFGDSDDFKISHSGGATNIINETGHITIQQRLDDGDIVFQCDDGSGGLTDYLRIDGSATNTKVYKDMRFLNNVDAQFGTNGDFKLYHDSSNMYLEMVNSGAGDIIIQNANDDKDIIFKSDDGGGGLATYFQLDGSEVRCLFSVNAEFSDNVKAKFGSSDDLEIYHDGSDSYIKDSGTGNLKVLTNTFNVNNAAGTEAMLNAIQDGAVNLYYNGTGPKLSTTSSGALVTGDLEIANSSDGIILESPNGTRYRVTVDNSGNLSTAAL